MAYRDYREHSASALREMFQVEIKHKEQLFEGFTRSERDYAELQATIMNMSARLRFSKYDNEATRGSLLVAQILWKAAEIYELGLFFEPNIAFSEDVPLELPHPLTGAYDGALSLDEIDLVAPIISVVEVKRSSLSDGFGQCLAEMYTTIQLFQQSKVYGIVTDGDLWEFLMLENSIVSVDAQNYHIHSVADIVERIGYIANMFKK